MKEIKGDLFTSQDNLCHCVSADMYMGKGIATEFKKRWGRPNGTYKVGDVAIIQDGERLILYLVTKERYWQKPTYESLQLCLDKVREMGLKSLSMPRIGCGLDGLSWNLVSKMIENTLNDVDITIYSL